MIWVEWIGLILSYICGFLLIAASFAAGYLTATKKNQRKIAEKLYNCGIAKQDVYIFNGRWYKQFYIKFNDRYHILHEYPLS